MSALEPSDTGDVIDRRVLPTIAALFACLAASTPVANSATSSTVVGATVPSATALSTLGCPSLVSGVTDFGNMLPGTTATTSADCTLTFGSSNDVARLLVRQADGTGRAMWAPPVDGTLDASFGTAGRTVSNLQGANDGDLQRARGTRDGGIVMVGNGQSNERSTVKYTASGAVSWTRFTDQCGANWEAAFDITELSTGAFVTAGACVNGAQVIELERLSAAGVPDATFGPGARVRFDPTAGEDYVYGLVADSTDRLVMVGYGDSTANSLLVRRLSTGAVDPSWAAPTLLDLGTIEQLNDVIIDSAGRIVATGWATIGGVNRLTVVRYLANGTQDPAFNSNAPYTLAIGGVATQGQRIIELADGDLLVAASFAGATATDVGLVRLTPSGGLRGTFGSGGIRTIDPGYGADLPNAIWELPDGRISVAIRGRGPSNMDFMLTRISALGVTDPTIPTGIARYDFAGGNTNDDLLRGAGQGPDGTVWMVGSADVAALGPDYGAMRLREGQIENFASGSTDWSVGASSFGACLQTLSGTATGSWPVAGTGNCLTTVPANWRAVPTTVTQIAASNASTNIGMVATLRFGLRTGSSQLPGAYIAPIEFSVLAP